MRWPTPAPDAPLIVHVALRMVLPIAVGAAIGSTLGALLGAWAVLVIVPPALVWNARELRWIKRMKAEMVADQARMEELLRRGS